MIAFFFPSIFLSFMAVIGLQKAQINVQEIVVDGEERLVGC